MKFRTWLPLLAILLALPVFGSTYYGGVEDCKGCDYDYNDIVYSITGTGLDLHTTTGRWFPARSLATNGTPFWNHVSTDAPKDNIGYCIYGGGSCNSGEALLPRAKYLATGMSPGSADNVTFTASGPVTIDILLQITAGKDRLGWYLLSSPNVVTWLNPTSHAGLFTFDPTAAFGLVEENSYYGPFYSQAQYGTRDRVSHFAFFVVPEPSDLALGLLGLSLIALRLVRKTNVSI